MTIQGRTTRHALKLLAAATLFAATGAAQAIPTTFTYTLDDLTKDPLDTQEDRGGLITAIDTSYVPSEQMFTWSHTIEPNEDGTPSDGFWLVVSDGENPKGDADEYAILFGDLTNQRLTAYLYNGVNSSNSWRNPGVYLQSFDADLMIEQPASSSTGTTVSFQIDVSGINSLDVNAIPGYPDYQPQPNIDWDGIAFGRQLGIWFHPTAGGSFEYNEAGEITTFRPGSAGWLDGKNYQATRVPEPGVLYLVGLGALAFALSQKLSSHRRRLIRSDIAPAEAALAV